VVTKVRCLARISDRLLSAVSARSSAASSSLWKRRTRVTLWWETPSCKHTLANRLRRRASSYLFLQLSLEHGHLAVGLLERFVQQGDVLLVLLALDHDLLDGALLLAQDLDGLGVAPLLLVELDLHVAHARLQLADDALAADDGVGLDLLEAYRQVLHLDLERLLDGLDLHHALLLLVQDLDGVLQLGLQPARQKQILSRSRLTWMRW
jgi:hypothetical protein